MKTKQRKGSGNKQLQKRKQIIEEKLLNYKKKEREEKKRNENKLPRIGKWRSDKKIDREKKRRIMMKNVSKINFRGNEKMKIKKTED